MPTASVLGATLVERLCQVVDLGCLLSLSRSRDGGSVSITVTSDGEWERVWVREEAEAILQVDEWLGVLEDERAESPPAAKPQRQRRARS